MKLKKNIIDIKINRKRLKIRSLYVLLFVKF